MGREPGSIPEYINHIAGYVLREVGEPMSDYKRRLFHLATEAYRRDYGEMPTEWNILHGEPRKQLTVHDELRSASNIKLRRIRER